ncbi:MAG: hypothetical protein H7263_04225 [Candidatus Sericytochromatia bacterium]|nr:hypothetical protein [Candidatus Sericytochromatia bacterium]
MNKKFVSGMIFGLALGVGVGATTPMFGAKDIVLKSNKPVKTKVLVKSSDTEIVKGDSSRESLQVLKDISSSMKENSDQNKQIIQQLENLNKKGGFGG